MRELEDLVEDKARLSRLLLSHLVNRSLYSAGLRSHQKIEMANGRHVNVFARKSKLFDVKKINKQYLEFYKIHAFWLHHKNLSFNFRMD